MQNKLTNLPFDQFTRQAAVSEIIDSTRMENENFSILDVGGYKGATVQFQHKDTVTVLDVYDVDEPGYIRGDGRELSFESNTYDYVVSFDALEHIKAEGREKFIAEMIRVAKYGIILTFPIKTEENQAAERQLNALYKKLYGKQHPWLKEHIDYTLPSLDDVCAIFKRNGLKSKLLFSNRTDVWFAMQSAMFITSANIDFAGDAMRKLNSKYNKVYSDNEGGDSFYRTISIGFKSTDRYKMFNVSYKSSKLESHTQPFSLLEKVNEFYIEVLANMRSEIMTRQHTIEDLSSNVEELKVNIDNMKNSKSYKIARTIQKTSAITKGNR